MNVISGSAKNLLTISIGLLNQPAIKEGVKNVVGATTFGVGLVAVYDLYQAGLYSEIPSESYLGYPKWVQVANRVTIVCAKISLILSAGVSRPGVFIISSLVGCIFSSSQLNRVFGPNTIFVLNPWHPRHVVSIAAVVLALPSLTQSTYRGAQWMYKKILQYPDTSPARSRRIRKGLTDGKIRCMTLFNTISSRPMLHLGNQLSRSYLL